MKDTDSIREDFEEWMRDELSHTGLKAETVADLLRVNSNNEYHYFTTETYWQKYLKAHNG